MDYPDEGEYRAFFLEVKSLKVGHGSKHKHPKFVLCLLGCETDIQTFLFCPLSQARFPGYEDRDLLFTTEVFVIPEELPYPPCEDLECISNLV